MHIECATIERQNRAGVLREINYWSFGPTDEKRARRAFLKTWDGAPEAEHHHYQATAEAIDRMRMARGEAPMGDFRRRAILRRPSR